MIGPAPTVALILLTAILGAALLRFQGRLTLIQAQTKLAQGTMPMKELVAGLFLAVGGALLLTPGFITDAVGFSCLIPGLRQLIIAWGLRHLKVPGQFSAFHSMDGESPTQSYNRTNADVKGMNSSSTGSPHVQRQRQRGESKIIEGECHRDD